MALAGRGSNLCSISEQMKNDTLAWYLVLWVPRVVIRKQNAVFSGVVVR